MVLEKLISGVKIVVNRVKEFGMVYPLVLEEKLLLPQHTHPPSPTPSCWRPREQFLCGKEQNTFRSRLAHAFDINGHDPRLYQ